MRFFLLFLLFFYSCNKDGLVKTYSIPKQQFSNIKNEVKTDLNLPFSWSVPDGWEEGKKSSMRIASYNIPFSRGTADLSITNFSGDGGGLLANINRWRGQINLPPKQTIEEFDKDAYTGKSNIGEFKMYKIFNESDKEVAFLCSIIKVKNSTIFVKLITTNEGVQELEYEFIKFCSSFSYAN